MPGEIADILIVVGRVLMGVYFVTGGVKHFTEVPQLVGAMTARGVPFPKQVMIAGSVWQIVLGVLVMTGPFVMWAALCLVLFTLLASIMFLDFWNKQGAERATAETGAQTNLALIGGLLVAAATAG
jgi:putative oxidoreductase